MSTSESPQAEAGPSLLVVRHGRGRGRLQRYMQPALRFLERTAPAVAARVRVHATGAPPPDLDGVAAVLFWLADPLRESFPDCYREAVAIAQAARRRGLPIVNPPEVLSNTIKSRQARIWRDAGIDTPPCLRFEDLDDLRARAREVGFPLVVRSDQEHNQRGMRVLRGPRQLAALRAEDLHLPGSVAPLWDTRPGWRERDPQSVYARYHHKMRIYVLGERVRTEHAFFARHPLVGAKSCTFARLDRLPRWGVRLALLRAPARDALREDLAYWRGDAEHAPLMRRAVGLLGLGFAAIDYSVRADGSAILWEANPYPSLPVLGRMRLPELREGQARMDSYHRAIGAFLADLIAAPAAAS
jgi:hypothetical protein